MSEQLQFFASLDFPPERTSLRLDEIAGKLGCTVQHLLNEIDSGALTTLDLKSKLAKRRAARVPVECYRAYVLSKLTGPVDFRMRFLRELPVTTRIELIEALKTSLRTNP